ncbi:MAG: hypothetical protein H6739_05080 [Alphaproteobacteria bacterium]|nr:hypothetical protein [Alphaproteobacteria bacterium]
MNIRRLLLAEKGPMAAYLVDVYETMGVEVVAAFDEASQDAPHLDRASFAAYIPSDAVPEALLDASNDAGCDGLHPGLGPLAEDPRFAHAAARANLLFVGSPAEQLAVLADRWTTRRVAVKSGVPVVPGTALVERLDEVDATCADARSRLGGALWIKDAGGHGAQRVAEGGPPERLAALVSARVADGQRVWIEREVRQARHLVVTVVGDSGGGALGLGVRERARRRDGRLTIDQFPASIGDGLARNLVEAAEVLAKKRGFRGVGSVGFLVDPTGGAWCLGLRPRLQLGTLLNDAVQEIRLPEVQLRVACGDRIGWDRGAITGRQDVALGFRLRADAPGVITRWSPPEGATVHTVAAEGCTASGLFAVLVVRAPTRQACVVRATAALRAFAIEGVSTNLEAHRVTLGDEGFWAGSVPDPDSAGPSD